MKTIGHHTCDADGTIKGVEEIKEHGPFLSIHTPISPKALGTGYYFFDNNVTAAHAHGANRYRRQYHIFKGEICIDDDVFLDLVGNRSDMLFIQEAMREFEIHLDAEKREKMTLGALIEFMKQANAFDYKGVRILDSSIMEEKVEDVKEKDRLYWFPDKGVFLNLNPIFTICFLEFDTTIIRSFEHHFSKK